MPELLVSAQRLQTRRSHPDLLTESGRLSKLAGFGPPISYRLVRATPLRLRDAICMENN